MVKKITQRLSGDERRLAIINAVRTVFAQNGFHGTTTRELASAAGISEALLFKHFPNKEALYDSVIESCADEPGFAEIVSNRFVGLTPSASTLVIMVHFMIAHFVKCCDLNKSIMDRLAVQSLLADGEFLRRTIKKVADTWIRKFEECVTAASESGDLRETPVRVSLRFWFTHHIAFSLMLHLDLPEDPALNYKASTDKLIEQAVWFALSGIGMKEESIKRHYNPKALAVFDKT
jgi:AcrR family transcriptional regulator